LFLLSRHKKGKELEEFDSYISKPLLTELNDNIIEKIEFYHADLEKAIIKLN